MGFLGTPLGWIMYGIDSIVKNYGITLILFIILTKIALIPLSIKQQKSTSKTAILQPKLKALEKKCGKDKAKYQSEMMKLYEQEGVSPTAGCLPMVIQMTLLFGIIDVIYKPLKHLLRVPKELIASSTKLLGKATSGVEIKIINEVQSGTNNKLISTLGKDWVDKINHFDMKFMGIDLGITPKLELNWLVIIPILAGVTAFLTTVVSMRQQARNGQQMKGAMKYMMYFMPLMSLWFAFTFPTGVGLYWIVSNIFMIGQTIILGKIYTPERLALENDKNSDKVREKMRKKREKLEAYNKVMNKKSNPNGITGDLVETESKNEDTSSLSEKERAKKRLAEARRRTAEKYGDNYTEE